MKICSVCARRFEAAGWKCPACGNEPEKVEGFPSFSPELARGGAGFDERFFEALTRAEEYNFWFAARNELIVDALRRHAPAARTFLDAGCGNGGVLRVLKARLPLRLTGAEPFVRGLVTARSRLADVELIQSDVRSLPYEGAFDAAGAFDVLEHIDDDLEALSAIRRALVRGGTLIMTVPQHRWLWSSADEIAHHRRRYTRNEIAEKLHACGFTVRFATSFVSLLLPVMLAARRARKKEAAAELDLPRSLNALFGSVMQFERALIRGGIRFPAGGSLLVVAGADA